MAREMACQQRHLTAESSGHLHFFSRHGTASMAPYSIVYQSSREPSETKAQFPAVLQASLYPCVGSRAVSLPDAWPGCSLSEIILRQKLGFISYT